MNMKITRITRTITGTMLATVMLAMAACTNKPEEQPAPSLGISPSAAPVSFPVAGDTFSYTVTTNQDHWDVQSDKTWCKAEKNQDGTGFTVTALPNSLATAPEDATVTVSAGGAADITITASQAGAAPALSILPALYEIQFPAEPGNQKYDYTVACNESSWTVVSNKEWCKATKNQDGTGFTVTASPNLLTTAMPDATITVSGVAAAAITITAAQPGNFRKMFNDQTEVAASYSDGTGASDDPYIINSAAELKRLVTYPNSNFYKLTTDITIESTVWTPIGYSSGGFQGVFDGGGHTISGKMANSEQYAMGFFNSLRGTVKNLNIDAEIISSYTGTQRYVYTGGIAGIAESGRIENCTVRGKITGCLMSGSSSYGVANYTGGITGFGNAITSCTNYAEIIGRKTAAQKEYANGYTGGITGRSDNGTILNCHNHGKVTSGNADCPGAMGEVRTGGIVGYNTGNVTGCSNSGAVKGGDATGAANGHTHSTCTGGISGYAHGNIHGSSNTGAITGGTKAKLIITGGVAGETIFSCVYRCCKNSGTVNGAAASTGNIIGGGSMSNCTDSH